MNTNNDEIFLKYVRGVKPIKKKYKIKKNTKLHPKILKQNSKTIKKEVINEKEIIEEKRKEKITKPQFLTEIFKKNKILKKERFFIDKKIDFHGKSLIEAEEEFQQTIVESYYQNKRCILFITGKGLHKKDIFESDSFKNNPRLFYGKIRESFFDWVKKPELEKFILSIKRASLEHGGDGAFFVYLRKNKTT